MTPRLVLFDIDGTLVFFRGAGRRAAVTAFGELFGIVGADLLTREVRLAGATDARIMRELAAACGIPRALYEQRRGELRRIYLQELSREVATFDGDPVLPGVRSLLASLAADGAIRLGLLTGNFEQGARIKLEPTGLDAYFPVGGFGDDHEDRRVVAQVAYERARAHHRVGFEPADVYVVGDTVHDVDCAKAHGFRAVAVCSGSFGRTELARAGADWVLDTLEPNPNTPGPFFPILE